MFQFRLCCITLHHEKNMQNFAFRNAIEIFCHYRYLRSLCVATLAITMCCAVHRYSAIKIFFELISNFLGSNIMDNINNHFNPTQIENTSCYQNCSMHFFAIDALSIISDNNPIIDRAITSPTRLRELRSDSS